MDISILSNINIDLLTGKLSKRHNIYKPEGYGVWVQEIANPGSGLYCFKPEAVFVILDGSELLKGKEDYTEAESQVPEYAAYVENAIKSNPELKFFISNIDLPKSSIKSLSDTRNEALVEAHWLKSLSKLSLKYSNLYIFDLKSMVEAIGRNDFYSAKMWYLGGMKFSLKAVSLMEKEVDRIINAIEGKRKKCILLDLDNTLWGGVVGEVGTEGIELSEYKEGARYKDFQKRLKDIKEQGIILAVVSKNNYEDAVETIKGHPHMVLKEEDFASMKINWNPKAQNIREIAQELNIGLDSMIFIDDNPAERESVKSELEGVIVPGFPEDTSELEEFMTRLCKEYFPVLRVTSEDLEKTEMYRQNVSRTNAMKSASSYDDFLNSLDTRITIWKALKEDIPRISQLTQKTNQFNLTTKRYTENDISGMMDSGKYDIYISSVEDKFGDNGKVSVIIVGKKDEKTALLDTFLLSCRVMGRFAEDRIISSIENRLRDEGFEELIANYYPTNKNKPVEGLFERLGYELVEKDEKGNKSYRIRLDDINIIRRKKFGEVILP